MLWSGRPLTAVPPQIPLPLMLQVVERLNNSPHLEKIHYFMSKADVVEKEHDRQRVLIQITQNLATRIRNSHAFNLPTVRALQRLSVLRMISALPLGPNLHSSTYHERMAPIPASPMPLKMFARRSTRYVCCFV